MCDNTKAEVFTRRIYRSLDSFKAAEGLAIKGFHSHLHSALQSVLAGVYRDFVDLQLQLIRLFPLTANLGGPGDVGDHRSPATFLVPFTPELVPDKRTLES